MHIVQHIDMYVYEYADYKLMKCAPKKYSIGVV